jgi:hypothetical protein
MLTYFFKVRTEEMISILQVLYSFLKFSKQNRFQFLYCTCRSDIGVDLDKSIGLYQCFRYALVSMRFRIRLLTSMRIRIRGAIPMRIHTEQDPGQNLRSQKVGFYILKKSCFCRSVYKKVNSQIVFNNTYTTTYTGISRRV